MKKLEAESYRPSVYSGELYLELHRGTLTNQHQIKRNNRFAEIAIRNLEFFTVRNAVENKVKISGNEIAPLTEMLLLNQFHDILPGTCIPRAHDESLQQTKALIEKAQDKIRTLAEDKENKYLVTAYNTLSFDREDVIYLPLEGDYYVKTQSLQQKTEDLHGKKCVAVAGVRIPAFGSKAFEFAEKLKCKDTQEVGKTFELYDNTLITPYYKAVFDEKGYISSLIDLEAERELKGKGYNLNTFLVAEDVPAAWDNWDVDADIEDKWLDCAQLLDRKVISCGTVEIRIRSWYQLTKKSALIQDMIFYSTDRKIVFETKIDWQDDHRFLKTAFDTTIQSNTARSEIQFGYIERATHRNTKWEKAKFEVSNHKYTDLSEPRYGAALMNDCKYGISVEGSSMWLSLHKGGCRPDYRGDKGVHYCSYAFLPHNAEFCAEAVVLPAYEFNVKPVVLSGKKEMDSFVKVNKPNILVETIKPMEDANGYVLRLYESEGSRTKVEIVLKEKGIRILQTNMLEEEVCQLPDNECISLEFGPFEIKTICVMM